jgi:glycosyltransferase involved in cell wall biosynthesis
MNNQNTKILMITYSSPDKLGRLRRCLDVLVSQEYIVDVLCNKEVTYPGVNKAFYFAEPDLSFSARMVRKMARLIRPLIPVNGIKNWLTDFILRHNAALYDLVEKYDIILVEHVDFLRPVIKRKRSDAKVIFDIKDYFPREFELEFPFRMLDADYYSYIFKEYLKYTNAIISVSSGLRALLQKEYGYDSIIIPNAPGFQQLEPSTVKNQIKLVHNGTSHGDRGLELMVSCKNFTKERTLDLYVVDVQNSLQAIRKIASNNHNIIFREPVPFVKLISTLNSYDVAVIFFPDGTVNNLYGLPNKFFEAIQARLMIITTPLPDMAKLVLEHDLGIVLPSYSLDALDDCLKQLTPSIVEHHKRAAHVAAKKLCFEFEETKLKTLFETLQKS